MYHLAKIVVHYQFAKVVYMDIILIKDLVKLVYHHVKIVRVKAYVNLA